MTPAELARDNAISFEAKKDSLRQMQNGDWRVSFTVQGVDMDERITRAAMGTRFIAVLVEINDQELPITRAEKEKPKPFASTSPTLQPDKDKPAGAKRDWKDLQPAQQAGIRCAEPTFRAFLREECKYDPVDENEAAEAVRDMCSVNSRAELNTVHASRMLWFNIDTQYQAWLAKERVGA